MFWRKTSKLYGLGPTYQQAEIPYVGMLGTTHEKV